LVFFALSLFLSFSLSLVLSFSVSRFLFFSLSHFLFFSLPLFLSFSLSLFLFGSNSLFRGTSDPYFLEYKNKGKVICKGDTIVLSNMSKSNRILENKSAVVQLIVNKFSEQDKPIVFMVELLDHQFFPVITEANRKRAKGNKQSHYSRYGDQMREHYLLCKFGQIEKEF